MDIGSITAELHDRLSAAHQQALRDVEMECQCIADAYNLCLDQRIESARRLAAMHIFNSEATGTIGKDYWDALSNLTSRLESFWSAIETDLTRSAVVVESEVETNTSQQPSVGNYDSDPIPTTAAVSYDDDDPNAFIAKFLARGAPKSTASKGPSAPVLKSQSALTVSQPALPSLVPLRLRDEAPKQLMRIETTSAEISAAVEDERCVLALEEVQRRATQRMRMQRLAAAEAEQVRLLRDFKQLSDEAKRLEEAITAAQTAARERNENVFQRYAKWDMLRRQWEHHAAENQSPLASRMDQLSSTVVAAIPPKDGRAGGAEPTALESSVRWLGRIAEGFERLRARVGEVVPSPLINSSPSPAPNVASRPTAHSIQSEAPSQAAVRDEKPHELPRRSHVANENAKSTRALKPQSRESSPVIPSRRAARSPPRGRQPPPSPYSPADYIPVTTAISTPSLMEPRNRDNLAAEVSFVNTTHDPHKNYLAPRPTQEAALSHLRGLRDQILSQVPSPAQDQSKISLQKERDAVKRRLGLV